MKSVKFFEYDYIDREKSCKGTERQKRPKEFRILATAAKKLS